MASLMLKLSAVLLITFLYISSARSIGQQEKAFPSELDLIDDNGSLDTALINYLFARQMINRLRNNLDVSDLRRKRSYWKQCAFNAVSCFGRK